jgi:glycosyltransferase involved in cell wall biosynthesis
MKLFYFYKIRKTYRDLVEKIDLESVAFIHSHFLFTDGGVAYYLKKKYGIRYITTIRNTDVNLYFKYFFWLKNFALKIVKNSEALVFISPTYKNFVFQNYIPKQLHKEFNEKSVIIPNGIDQFWIDNSNYEKKLEKGMVKFLYVGDLSKNKNIHKSIDIIKKLRNLQPCTLLIIGSGGSYAKKINRLVSANSDFVSYLPKINDKNKLLEHFRSNDIFIMPSKTETFGLVYVEAMTQGLPCLYSTGQGIDGYFKNGEVGYSINPDDIETSIKSINLILNDYTTISKNCINSSKLFNWDAISEKFITLYKKNGSFENINNTNT